MKTFQRPSWAEPGSLPYKQAGIRLRLSRQRLIDSELASTVRAWRLWAICVEAMASYSRGSDVTYVTTLADRAGMDRWVAGKLLRRFDELGIFSWRSGERGTHDAGLLSLPSRAEPEKTKPEKADPPKEETEPCAICGQSPATFDTEDWTWLCEPCGSEYRAALAQSREAGHEIDPEYRTRVRAHFREQKQA